MIAGNVDWPSNNNKFWKPAVDKGKWRYLLYDLDATMAVFGWIAQDIDMFRWVFEHRAGTFHSELLRGLMGNAEFKRGFVNRMADLMNTAFAPEAFQAEVDRITTAYEGEIQDHFTRWECWHEYYQQNAYSTIPYFTANRAGFVREHAINWFSFGGAPALRFEVFPPGAGGMQINTISPQLPFVGHYFHGNEIDITAEAAPGYEFDRWVYANEGAIPGDTHLRRTFSEPGAITAYFKRADGGLSVQPNPASDLVLLGVEARQEGIAEVSVMDATGRLLLIVRPAVRAGVNEVRINLSPFRSGLLIVQAITDAGSRSVRLLKQ
jgi:hypothetical protein